METKTLYSLKFQIKEILENKRVSIKKPTLYKKTKICMKLIEVFEQCEDVRVKGRCIYRLPDLILMIFLAMLA